jgi:peptidoglycan-N-acetylglucosamine deacetylase
MFSDLYPGLLASAGAAVGVGAAAFWAYTSRSPRSRLFGDALTAPGSPGELALTFDDGPNPAWTPQLLDVLERHKVRATFFLLGGFAQAEPELVRRIAQAGHLIGNHSWSHPDLSCLPAKEIRDELSRTSVALEQMTGSPVRYFRPPFGARRPAVFHIARELGLRTVLWNAMTADWSEPSAERIAERLKEKIDRLTQRGRGANIVLHDGDYREQSGRRGPSVTAAGSLLARYASIRRFVRLDAWT